MSKFNTLMTSFMNLKGIKTIGNKNGLIVVDTQQIMKDGMRGGNKPGPTPVDPHEYVDLELPSGTLWATCNIGAENPEDAGLYFQWGDTQGYTAEQVGTYKIFDLEHYKYYDSKSSSYTKYTEADKSGDGKSILEPGDDAATVNWGNNWRMPTVDEINELIDNTTHKLDTVNNISGMRFSSNNGNSIFVPFAGNARGSSVLSVGDEGYCWSSSLSSKDNNNARCLLVISRGGANADNYGRYYGFCVRPVYNNGEHNIIKETEGNGTVKTEVNGEEKVKL